MSGVSEHGSVASDPGFVLACVLTQNTHTDPMKLVLQLPVFYR